MTKHPFAVVDGEYTGDLGTFYASVRKLHPDVKKLSEGNPLVYEIGETVGGCPMRITITVRPGRTFIGGDPCYDVYILGTSLNGDCRQFIDRIVAETQLNVMPQGESKVIKQGNQDPAGLESVVATQIGQIMAEQRL